MSDLITAIQTLATKLIPNSTGAKKIAYISRLNEYSGRLLASVLPVPADDPQTNGAGTADEPLSVIPSTAIAQIVAATGNPVVIDDDGTMHWPDNAGVLAAASPEQIQQLDLLHYFGVGIDDQWPTVDHTLRDRYYSNQGMKPIDPDVNAWADYLSKRS